MQKCGLNTVPLASAVPSAFRSSEPKILLAAYTSCEILDNVDYMNIDAFRADDGSWFCWGRSKCENKFHLGPRKASNGRGNRLCF